jgi:hypothetical protein
MIMTFTIARAVATACLAASLFAPAQAAVVGFTNNPTGNSTDWSNFVASTTASVTAVLDFEAHPLGALNGAFYAGQGVTMSLSAPIFHAVLDVSGVPSGSGTCPCSTGEGPFPASRALVYLDQMTLMLNFASAVSAVGLLTGDHFDPFGTDPIIMEAFTGVNGTGTSLGTAVSFPRNYQLGFSYFMGVASTTNEILSVRVTDGFSGTSDGVDIDNIRIAQLGAAIPEPATLGVLGLGLAGLLGLRRRR